MARNSVAYMVMEAFNVGGATGGTGGVVGGTVEVQLMEAHFVEGMNLQKSPWIECSPCPTEI